MHDHTSTRHRRVCPLIPDARWNPKYIPRHLMWVSVPWPGCGFKTDSSGKRRFLKHPRLCPCGAMFKVASPSNHKKYCSPACVRLPLHGPSPSECEPAPGPTLDQVKECSWCGLWMPSGRKYCSNVCVNYGLGRASLSVAVRYGTCRRCGDLYVRPTYRRDDAGTCSTRCTKTLRKYERRHLKRVKNGGESFTLREIAERDGWVCHLCGGKVPDREYKARDNDPTLDHLVPVSDGGEHIRRNVALAHNRCNWERGAEGAAQLRLVG